MRIEFKSSAARPRRWILDLAAGLEARGHRVAFEIVRPSRPKPGEAGLDLLVALESLLYTASLNRGLAARRTGRGEPPTLHSLAISSSISAGTPWLGRSKPQPSSRSKTGRWARQAPSMRCLMAARRAYRRRFVSQVRATPGSWPRCCRLWKNPWCSRGPSIAYSHVPGQ